MTRRKLIVAGWSTRAAAQSARRGDYRVTAVDVFQDADLQAAAEVTYRIRSLRELASRAAELPAGDWLYTGGLENQAALIAKVSARHRLLGNDAAVLRRVRDPRRLQTALAGGPAPLPETRWTVPDRGDGRTWLVKYRNSGGGTRVAPYKPPLPLPRGAYLQEFAAGVAGGASYLAAGGRCRFLGLCRQLPATTDSTRPFLYGGSLGPIALPSRTAAALTQLGEQIVAEFSLRGLFGVDVMLGPGGSLRTLEINPRYTASMELLERAGGRSLIDLHLRACCESELPAAFSTGSLLQGKRIFYVDETVPRIISSQLAAAMLAESRESDLPWLADIPPAGTRPRRGEPFCTIFAAGRTEREVERGLDESVRRLKELLTREVHEFASLASPRLPSRRRRPASSGS